MKKAIEHLVNNFQNFFQNDDCEANVFGEKRSVSMNEYNSLDTLDQLFDLADIYIYFF